MALGKLEAFPVDRRIRRAVENYFLSEAKAIDATMVRWAQDHFGSYGGYAGHTVLSGPCVRQHIIRRCL